MSTEIDGGKGRLKLHRWGGEDPKFVAVIVHGLAEHAGRYNHVAQALVDAGAATYAVDHYGHGASEGEKGVVEDIELLVDDTARVVELARAENPGLPRRHGRPLARRVDRDPLRAAARPRAHRARAVGARRRRQPGPDRAARAARVP